MIKIKTIFSAVLLFLIFINAVHAATWVKIGNGCTVKQQTFNASGTFYPSAALMARGGWVEVLMVGGGGGSCYNYLGSAYGLGGSILNRMVQIAGATGVGVGAGAPGCSYWPYTTIGGDSSFGSLTAIGGISSKPTLTNTPPYTMSTVGLGWSNPTVNFPPANSGGGGGQSGGSGVVIITFCE